MTLNFTAKTNKDYCRINTATFRLKSGGTITLDRDATRFSVNGDVLDMTWTGVYVWEVNGRHIFDSYNPRELYVDGEELCKIIDWAAPIDFDLEDDADEDYEVTNIEAYY